LRVSWRKRKEQYACLCIVQSKRWKNIMN